MGLNRLSGAAREPGLGAEAAASRGRRRRAGGGKLAASPAKVAAAGALLVIPALAAVYDPGQGHPGRHRHGRVGEQVQPLPRRGADADRGRFLARRLAPTGTVKFSDAAGILCTGTLSGGKAHCTHTFKATGRYAAPARAASPPELRRPSR